MIYKVEFNNCTCHPETCCCDKWKIVDSSGKTLATSYRKVDAEQLVEKLND